MAGEELAEFYTIPVILSMKGIEKQAGQVVAKQMGDVGAKSSQAFTKGFATEARSSQQQLKKLSQNYEKLYDRAADAADKLKVAQAGVQDVTDKGITSGKRYEAAIAAQNKAQRDHTRALKLSEDALKEYEKAAKDASKAGGRVADSIQESASTGFRGAANEAVDAGRETASGFASGFAGASALTRIGAAGGPVGIALAGAVALGVGAGKVLADNIAIGMEQVATLDLFQARLGIDEPTMKRYGEAAADAYVNAFGESVEANLSTLQFASQAGIIDSSATQEEVAQVISQMETLRTLFEAEPREIARAMNQLVRTGLAKDFTEASDILVTGFQNGLDVSDDFLDSVTEYSTQFRELGLSAGDTLSLLKQGLEGGARDTDKVADALKEFAIRAKDGSDLTASAFESLGMNAQDTMAIFAEGGEPARQKLDEVLDRIRQIPDAYDQGLVTQALFGTQAEDLQDAFNNLDLSAPRNEVTDFAGSTERAMETAADNSATEWEKAGRNIEDTFRNLRSKMADWFSFIPEWFNSLFDPAGTRSLDAPPGPDPTRTGPMILGQGGNPAPTTTVPELAPGLPIPGVTIAPSSGPGPGFTIGGPGGPQIGQGGNSPAFATGGDTYGLPANTDIRQGAPGFPPWVYQVAEAFGLKASTYAGHQTDRGHGNQGIDWWGPLENRQRFAEFLAANAANIPGLEDVIFRNPVTGQDIGVNKGRLVGTPGSADPGYFRRGKNDFLDHTDHVHTTQSAPIPLPSVPMMPGGRGSTGGIPPNATREQVISALAARARAEGLSEDEVAGVLALAQAESNFDRVGFLGFSTKTADTGYTGGAPFANDFNKAMDQFFQNYKQGGKAAAGGPEVLAAARQALAAGNPQPFLDWLQNGLQGAVAGQGGMNQEFGPNLRKFFNQWRGSVPASTGVFALGNNDRPGLGPGPVSPNVINAFGPDYEPGIGTPGFNEFGEPGYYETDTRRIAQANRGVEDSLRRIADADQAIVDADKAVADAQAERDRIAGMSDVERKMNKADLDKADADLQRARDQADRARLEAQRSREDAQWAQEDLEEAKQGTFRPAREASKKKKGDKGGGSSELGELGSIASSFLQETFGFGSWLPDLADNPWVKSADALIGSLINMAPAPEDINGNVGVVPGGATSGVPFGIPDVIPPPMPPPGQHTGSGLAPGPTYVTQIDQSQNFNNSPLGWDPAQVQKQRDRDLARGTARLGAIPHAP